jgi:hypothetical protein
MIMHRDSYGSERNPRGYDLSGVVYLTNEDHGLATIVSAGVVLRNRGVGVLGEGTTMVAAIARPGQVEEAFGHLNTGRGLALESAEGYGGSFPTERHSSS